METWTDCETCGDPIDYCLGHPKHAHEYRDEIADWWCIECQTVTDFCQQLNPF